MANNTSSNRLDTIDETMDLVALIADLVVARSPDSMLELSPKAASGLLLVLEHAGDVLGDAASGLSEAQAEIGAFQKIEAVKVARQEGYLAGWNSALEIMTKLQPEWEEQAKAALSRMPVPDLTEPHDEAAPTTRSTCA